MDIAFRIVTRLPLDKLWRENGFIATNRVRYLTDDDITNLLRLGRVEFVIADVGISLRWIPLDQCFDFWNEDARIHLAEPDSQIALEKFADGYCYFASEWSSENGDAPIVVLEKHH